MESKVKGPALGLMVTAGLGVLAALAWIALTLFPIGGDPADLYGEQFAFLSGAVGIGFSLVGIAICGFIYWGAQKMKNLESWGIALGASIVAMIPCLSPCCYVGLPIGIWAIVVLLNDEVKRAFKS